jgi:hypothetical protein
MQASQGEGQTEQRFRITAEADSSRCFFSLKQISGLPRLATNTLLIGFRYL